MPDGSVLIKHTCVPQYPWGMHPLIPTYTRNYGYGGREPTPPHPVHPLTNFKVLPGKGILPSTEKCQPRGWQHFASCLPTARTLGGKTKLKGGQQEAKLVFPVDLFWAFFFKCSCSQNTWKKLEEGEQEVIMLLPVDFLQVFFPLRCSAVNRQSAVSV